MSLRHEFNGGWFLIVLTYRYLYKNENEAEYKQTNISRSIVDAFGQWEVDGIRSAANTDEERRPPCSYLLADDKDD